MMNSTYWKGLRLWVLGFLLLSLRWAQVKTGFDPETGLSRASAPGTALAVAIVLLIAAEAALSFRLPKGKRSYLRCMEPIEKNAVPVLAGGSFLLGFGGLLSMEWGLLGILCAACAAAAAAGLIAFAQRLRKSGKVQMPALLPVMVFSVVFLLTVYVPEESNPVLARYYLPVLAAALPSCAFYQLAGFTCREGSLGWFAFFGDLSVVLCLAAMADCAENWGRIFVYFGYALILTQFLMLRRGEPLPEPAPKTEEA